jgi:hypothetical protein
MGTRKNCCTMALLLALTHAGVVHSARIDGKYLLQQARQETSSIRVEAHSPGAPVLELELRRFEVFSADAQLLLVTGTDQETQLARPATRYFSVHNAAADTRGLIAVHADDRVQGIVQHKGLYQRVHLAGDELRLETLDAKADPGRSFQCGNDSMGDAQYRADTPAPAIEAIMPEAGALLATRTARVAIDSDEEFLTRFSGNSETATEYVGLLIGFISTIYDVEVATTLQVSFLRLWTPGTDPWTQSTPGCLMLESGKHWNDNQSGINRTLMHFFSGRGQLAGIAWIGVLCSGPFNGSPGQVGATCPGLPTEPINSGGAYGATLGLSGSFNPANPVPVWDVVSIAHEIGHNFNSPHTHCYAGLEGNAEPIDMCANASGPNCHAGATSLPGPLGAGSGTLMSYCHLRQGGMSNLTLTLGTGHPFGVAPERVPTRMAAHAAARAASNPSCLALVDTVNLFRNGFE